MQNIGGNLKRIRAERGLSQEELGLAAGVGQPMISAIETGAKLPSLVVAFAIASFLQITLDELNRPAVNRADTTKAA